jgi:NADPH2:quinone reductase
MTAINITAFGDPSVLQAVQMPIPTIEAGEVLIKTHAAGVNRPDLLQRKGLYPPPKGASEILGLEVAGEIIETKSPDFQIGDRVCALLSGGGYAEYAAAPAGQCLIVPDGVSMQQACALPETVFTVWNNLFMRGNLQKGESVLIHGGASGIGTTAIQMARQWGCKIYVTAGTDEKCQACLDLGADVAINYKTHTFVDEIADNSINVVLDMVGGDYVPQNLTLLKTDGRHISIAFLRGTDTTINLKTIMHKRILMTGSTLRPRSLTEKTALRDGILETVWPWVKSGTLKPLIFKSFPLVQASAAHEALEKGDHIGKIVLSVL